MSEHDDDVAGAADRVRRIQDEQRNEPAPDEDDLPLDPSELRPLGREIFIGLGIGVLILIAIVLAIDWLNPCGGQITDWIGCLARSG